MQLAGAASPPPLASAAELSATPRPVTYSRTASQSDPVARMPAGLACEIGAYVEPFSTAAFPWPSAPTAKTPGEVAAMFSLKIADAAEAVSVDGGAAVPKLTTRSTVPEPM